ncbi:MAG: hypothetical protein ACI9O3_000710 [Colwellia sp.]|jgi:hypothetical protein|uniref:hypothetical protein n=1 Tax=unclassified Colwellia TaxID=196834 RepID=UPI0015F48740|nr:MULTISPECIES: hypothetical protein [unclassified Colwellia]MBA6251206.1 hypothetical protein [Colwellia sp. MB3u-55]MBA6399211.1 hypothetical protein [Colwellia sp. BRX10-4]
MRFFEAFMAKALCKWKKKDIEKSLHELAHIVDKPRFICKDCARSAHDKNFLCKAITLPLNHPPS